MEVRGGQTASGAGLEEWVCAGRNLLCQAEPSSGLPTEGKRLKVRGLLGEGWAWEGLAEVERSGPRGEASAGSVKLGPLM